MIPPHSNICVGRSPQLEQISRLLEAAAGGDGQALIVTGEPGIGKTTLLTVAAQRAEQLGMQIARGSAEELERCLPFSAISGCLDVERTSTDPRRVRVAEIMCGTGRFGTAGALAGPAMVDFATVEALLALVDELCAAGPLLMILDDLHWADSASLLVLHRLARSLSQLPLLIIASYRTVPKVPELIQLRLSLSSRRNTPILLGPLAPTGVSTLVTELVGGQPGPRLQALVAEAAGNPLYITEFINALSRDSAITFDAGVAEVNTAQAPASLADAILHRLSFISTDALNALRVASVLGSCFSVATLTAVLGRSVSGTLENVMEAIDAGVLVDSGEHLTFRHDLIRRVLCDAQPLSVRVKVHLEASRALASAGSPVEQIAEHLLDGASADGAWLVSWVTQSAAQLTGRAPQLAVRLLEEGLRIAGPQDGRCNQLRLHLTVALLCSGRAMEAEQQARHALAHNNEPAMESALYWILAQSHFLRGRPDLAMRVTEQARSSSVGISAIEASRFHAFASVCLVSLGELEKAEVVAEAALSTAGNESNDGITRAYALQTLAATRILESHYDGAIDLLQEALRIIPETLHSCPRLALQLSLGNSYIESDRTENAGQTLRAGRKSAEQHGGFFLPWYHLSEALLYFNTGRWDDAMAEIQAGLEPGEHFRMSRALRGLAALITIHRGQTPKAAMHLAASREDADTETIAPFYEHIPLLAAALDYEAQGATEQAFEVLFAASEADSGASRGHPLVSFLAPDLVRLALLRGNIDYARHATLGIEAIAETSGAPHHLGDAHRCRGLLESAPDRLLKAAEFYGRSPRPLSQGQSYSDAAELLAHAGSKTEARDLIRRSLNIYAELDATWVARRDEARLRALGVRCGHRRHSRPSHGWSGLTEAQLKVTAHVAQGYSNPDIAVRLFISRRTVQSHVSNILTKLNLSSRAELAAEYARRGAQGT
ncbi:ATP-binding protein [Streptomyces sp. NPDC015125]|uniref:ATP-binding protein n=1 Tax=Streptomyces sp. NPDC015125 TaxID=3364938 RepID=UPI0036FF80FC